MEVGGFSCIKCPLPCAAVPVVGTGTRQEAEISDVKAATSNSSEAELCLLTAVISSHDTKCKGYWKHHVYRRQSPLKGYKSTLTLQAFLAVTPNLLIDFHVTLAIDLAVVEK